MQDLLKDSDKKYLKDYFKPFSTIDYVTKKERIFNSKKECILHNVKGFLLKRYKRISHGVRFF